MPIPTEIHIISCLLPVITYLLRYVTAPYIVQYQQELHGCCQSTCVVLVSKS